MADLPDVEDRVGNLEKWQGIVDYRLEEGEKRFRSIDARLIEQSTKQNEMALNILNGNRDTADVKKSIDSFIADYKQEQQNRAKQHEADRIARRSNRPQWIHIALVAVATLISVIALGTSAHWW